MINPRSFSCEEYCNQIDGLGLLTASEQRLDHYIQAHFNELSFHGIVDIAQNASVSKATVGRFLNKLGFTGYSAFRQAVAQALPQEKMVSPFELVSRDQKKRVSATEQVVADFSHNVSELFAQFQAGLDYQKLDELITLILNTERKIYVVGPSSSHAMARHFVTLIQYFRDNVTLLTLDAGDLPKSLLNISSKDVLIVFSWYRFNSTVIKVTEWFRNKKATVVLMTNSESNPYGKFSHMQFILPSDAQSVFKSRIMGFFFIELILHLAWEQGETDGNFEQLETLFTFFDTFSPGT